MKYKQFIKDKNAFAIMTAIGIGLVIFLILGAIVFYFIMQSVIANIIPIAAAIVLVICVPTIVKAYSMKWTSKYGGKTE